MQSLSVGYQHAAFAREFDDYPGRAEPVAEQIRPHQGQFAPSWHVCGTIVGALHLSFGKVH